MPIVVTRALEVNSGCYREGVTRVLIRFSSASDALKADEGAVVQQLRERAAIGEFQRCWRQLGQRVEHKRAGVHVVMRHLEAGFVNQAIAEQQDVQVQCARAPAFMAFAALIQLDGLQRIEQGQRCQAAVDSRDGIGLARLAGQQRVALVER